MDNNLALHEAITALDMDNFDRLLHHPDVDINYKNGGGETPLMASINRDCGSMMAMTLISAGCDINCKGVYGWTALHKAVAYDLIEVARELILRKADINARDESNHTPLSTAISVGNLEAVCLLLYYQADVNTNVVLFYKDCMKVDIIDGVCNVTLSCCNIAFDDAIDDGDHLLGTHLMRAVERNHNDICVVLLDYCEDISYENELGETAFSFAVCNENPLAIDLLKRGSNVNTSDHYGFAPIDFALSRDIEIFKMILCQLDYETYLDKHPFFLRKFMFKFFIREIELKDRISVLYIYLGLGAGIKADDLQWIHLLFGSNGDFEAVVYAGDLSYNDYKKQMRLLFKEPFKSDVPEALYDEFLYSDNANVNVRANLLCSLGYFSVLPEERKEYLDWIEILFQPRRRFVFENLFVSLVQTERVVPTPQFLLNIRNTILNELDRIPQFPSLLELSRDKIRQFIEENFEIHKAYQFYDIVKTLNLPQSVKNIILFKQPIY